MKKVSLQDIANQLNVSKSLVSFVLNGQGDEKGIHPDTQQKVIRKARELNYKPNFIARGLRMGKSHTLGLIVADISNNFYARIAKRVEEVAAMNGYHLIYCSSDEDTEKEVELIGMLRDRQVDGLIISTTQCKSSFFTELKKERFPFVLIDRQLPMLRTNYVGVENYEGAYRATEQLIRNGFRRIALLKISPAYLSTVRERERGYRDALRDNGIRVANAWVREIGFKDLRNQVSEALGSLLVQSCGIDAIFSVNNNLTVACLEYFRDKRIDIPAGLGLISFDDIDLFRLSHPGITAVAQPQDQIGEEAVKILLGEINGNSGKGPVTRVLPVRLEMRASSGSTAPAEKSTQGKVPQVLEFET